MAINPQSIPSADGENPHPQRLRQLVKTALQIFGGQVDPAKQKALVQTAIKVEKTVGENCAACQAFQSAHPPACAPRAPAPAPAPAVVAEPAGAELARDPRRQRFLLRLVAGRVSHLFLKEQPVLPKTIVEALDRYLHKSMGEMIYVDLNNEAELLLEKVDTNKDDEMWERINANPDWKRFSDTILIRMLLRFENYAQAKKTFQTIIEGALQELCQSNFTEGHFFLIFDCLFGDIAKNMEREESRLRWDYMFGDDTSRKMLGIIDRFRTDRSKPGVRR